ncbi:LysR family transcriptional regulator, partial [Patulibacter sp. S7RM1-6]
MNLTLQQLRMIVAVARRASFTAAAADLHLSQSALSRAINEAERTLGVRLFHRTTRSVRPTPEGEELVRLAADLLDEHERGLRRFARFVDGMRGTVRIGTLPSLAASVLPALIVRLHAEAPEARVQVEDGLADELATAVRDGRVDLAITVDRTTAEDLEFRPLARDRFSCVHPPGHRFAGRETVAWRELEHEAFVAFDGHSSIRTLTDRTFEDVGVRPADTLEASSVAAITGLVAAGLGVSAVPALVLPLTSFAGLGRVPLADPVVERTIGVLTVPDGPRSPLAARFLRLLGAHAAAVAL